MAIREVVITGDEILRKKSKPVQNFDESLWTLLSDMRETMHANEGMGLAAVQVGMLKCIVIVECNGMFLELINPKITTSGGEDIDEEGCLSVGKFRGYVKRPSFVTVKAQDRYGYDFVISGEKYLARVLCHEIDHLNGVLFTDLVISDYKKKGSKD